MRRFVIGDIHGGYRALLQVFEKANFDYEKDQLICLGDVADGWSQVSDCFDELLKIKNLVYILGNHDNWLLDWFRVGERPPIWTSQGGMASIESYVGRFKSEGNAFSKPHENLLANAHLYYVTKDNRLFVHGGINWHIPAESQSKNVLTWDRDLYETALYWEKLFVKTGTINKVKLYDEVFIGHTSTCYSHPDMLPVHASNVWNLDQGAGWEGKLTLMDIDTKEYWQSDIVKTLYPNEKGR